jgi:hypothetical protein
MHEVSGTIALPRATITLLVTSLLVFALGIQNSSASTSSAADQTKVSTPQENPILIGAAISPHDPRTTVAAELAYVESQAGPLELRRVFDPSNPFKANFMDLAGADVGLRATHYSFKPDMTALAGGALDAKIISLLNSIPPRHRTMLTVWHEPEDNFITDEQQATYRAAWQRFADLVHATDRAELTTSWVMMSYSWRIASGRDPMDWYPGDAYVDSVGIDTYNEGSLNMERWDSPGRAMGLPAVGDTAAPGGYIYGGAVRWIQSRGLAWGVSEFGTLENVANIDSGWSTVDEKWKWIRQATSFYVSEGASYIEYFHSGPYRGPWWLDSSPEAMASFKWALKTY